MCGKKNQYPKHNVFFKINKTGNHMTKGYKQAIQRRKMVHKHNNDQDY